MIKKQIKILASLKDIIAHEARTHHVDPFQEIETLVKRFMDRHIPIHDVKVTTKATLMLRYNTSFNDCFYMRILNEVEYNHTTFTAYINKALYYELIANR